MTKLTRLFTEHGQSPWLDNLTRPYLRDGTHARLVGDGIRGVTANSAIFATAIEGSSAYDDQFAALIGTSMTVPDAYWELFDRRHPQRAQRAAAGLRRKRRR
jgi:transaldolase